MPVTRVLEHARATGVVLHIVHVTSSSLAAIGDHLAAIDVARHRGDDVTTEVYPYTAGSTLNEVAVYDEGWREKRGSTLEIWSGSRPVSGSQRRAFGAIESRVEP
jgi:hypothetical protein